MGRDGWPRRRQAAANLASSSVHCDGLAVKGAPLYGGLTSRRPSTERAAFLSTTRWRRAVARRDGHGDVRRGGRDPLPGSGCSRSRDEEFLRPFKYYRMQRPTFLVSAVAGRPAMARSWSTRSSRRSPAERTSGAGEAPLPRAVRLGAGGGKTVDELQEARVEEPDHRPRRDLQGLLPRAAYRVLDRVKVEGDAAVGSMAGDLPVDTVRPRRAAHGPRLAELCFQTRHLGVKTNHVLALPAGLESVTAHRRLQDAEAGTFTRS